MDNRADTAEPDDPAYAAELPLAEPGGYDYDAFLSYSRADAAVAEGIQKGLHTIGRKLGRLHALRVFRDKTDLAASPSLWAKLSEALDKSRYLVVVLSPNSAGSEWVNKEIDYWLKHRGRNNLVLVMADGTLLWDDSNGRFDPDNSTAAPPALATPDSLGTEPVYIDVSHDNPWDIQNPTFRDKLTDIAAPIHGKPKYELASDDLREQQRFRRFRRLAITALALLLVIAIAAASVAFIQRREAQQQRNEAIHQRNDAVARGLVADADAIFKRVRGGTYDQALQELTVAARLGPVAALGGMLTGLQNTAILQKIIRTSRGLVTPKVTPDGKRIITGSKEEPVIRIWDGATGQQVSELTGTPKTGLWVVGLSPDGKSLISEDSAGVVRLWDLDTSTIIRQLKAELAGDAVTSADGARMAAVDARWGPDKKKLIYRLGVWDAATGEPVSMFPEQSDSMRELALSPDGRRVVIVDGDGAARIFDVDSREQIGETIAIPRPSSSDGSTIGVHSPEFSPDGRRFVMGLSDGTVRQWDAFTGAPISTPMAGHTGLVFHVTYSPDGTRIASGGTGDTTVRVWDAETGAPVGVPFAGHLDAIEGLTFTPDGKQIVSISSDKTIQIWRADSDTRLGGPISAPAGNLPEGTPVVGVVPGGETTDVSRSAAIWNLGDGRVTDFRENVPYWQYTSLLELAVTPDGRRAAVRSTKMQVWDLHTGKTISSIDVDTNTLAAIAISPDGSRVVTGASSSSVEKRGGRLITLYDADTGKQIDTKFDGLDGTITALRFSPDGRQLVAVNSKGALREWDAATGQQIGDPWSGDLNAQGALAFSPDGQLLASAGRGTIWIWDTQTHRLAGKPLTGHNDPPSSLAFSSDGRLLVSGASDSKDYKKGEMRIWDVKSGQQIGEPLPVVASKAAFQVAFSSDTTKIFASGAASKGSGVWQWPGPARWPDLLCDKLTANMSRTQWKQWVSPDIEYVPGCPDLPVPE
ncbi:MULTISPECIES: TIR domain-containing protein [unclassified Mycobacteroides]|uniref:TIR domain-containing protein n=1 Tax=unclassified Mycobacteroides TaxID=2618759 RepID=UPI001396B038|nr:MULTISPECIES: TIR domain-containing protein [unclassified Mycobacteroides]